MLPRSNRLRVPVDPFQEKIVPAKIEGVSVPMADLMNFIRRVHDEAGDTARIAGPEADTDNAPVKGPVRGDPEGHEGVVIGHVDDGVSVEVGQRDTDHGKAAIIGPVAGNEKGFVGHADCVADILMLNG